MEKTIAKYLREENSDAVFGQLRNVNASISQSRHLADGQALHALHHDHFGVAVVPIHFRNEDQVEALHVAAQLRSVGGFSHQVQLVVQMLVEFGNHFSGL